MQPERLGLAHHALRWRWLIGLAVIMATVAIVSATASVLRNTSHYGDLNSCRARYGSAVTAADRDWKHFFTQVLLVPPADDAAKANARAALAAVDDRQIAAAAAADAYARHPTLPCPLKG